MVDTTSVSAIVAAAGVMVGVTISIIELRNIVRARQAELFLDLYDHYNDPDFVRCYSEIVFQWNWKDYGDWQKKYGPQTNIEAYSLWASLGNYFKGVGVLVNEKLIDIRLVDKLMAELFLRYWEKCEPIVKDYRKDYKFPRAWETVEYLANELQKRKQQLTKTH